MDFDGDVEEEDFESNRVLSSEDDKDFKAHRHSKLPHASGKPMTTSHFDGA
jgi:hypothetical protein